VAKGREASHKAAEKVSDAKDAITEKLSDAGDVISEKVSDAKDAATETAKKVTRRSPAKPATDVPPTATEGDTAS